MKKSRSTGSDGIVITSGSYEATEYQKRCHCREVLRTKKLFLQAAKGEIFLVKTENRNCLLHCRDGTIITDCNKGGGHGSERILGKFQRDCDDDGVGGDMHHHVLHLSV